MKHVRTLSELGAPLAGVGNWLARRPWVRRALESLAGIDRPSETPPVLRIEDIGIGIAKLHQVPAVRKLQQRGDRVRGPQRGAGTEKRIRGI